MTKIITNLDSENSEKANQFRARIMAQLLVIFIALTLMAIRISFAATNAILNSIIIKLLYQTVPILAALCLIVILKYILFKKQRTHSWVLKYSNFIDLVFAVMFTAEWLMSLKATLELQNIEELPCQSLFVMVIIGSFSWRTLLQLLISQLWQVRIIAPTAAWIFLIQFAARHYPGGKLWVLFYGISSMLYTILIFYFEHKMNFTFMIGSIHQQQWLKLNQFILNNIPENIAIMDLDGNSQFISDNFKKLMNKRTQEDEVKEFLRNIRDIQKQQSNNTRDYDEPRLVIFL